MSIGASAYSVGAPLFVTEEEKKELHRQLIESRTKELIDFYESGQMRAKGDGDEATVFFYAANEITRVGFTDTRIQMRSLRKLFVRGGIKFETKYLYETKLFPWKLSVKHEVQKHKYYLIIWSFTNRSMMPDLIALVALRIEMQACFLFFTTKANRDNMLKWLIRKERTETEKAMLHQMEMSMEDQINMEWSEASVEQLSIAFLSTTPMSIAAPPSE